jgi:cytochrome c oxidase subunit II
MMASSCRSALLCVVATALLAGCSGWQSALDPRGPEARYIADLIWTFTALCGLIWLVTLLLFAIALWRQRRAPPREPLHVNRAVEQRMGKTIAAAIAAVAVTLIGLSGLSYAAQKRLYSSRNEALSLKIIGHQWWWEIQYEDLEPYKTFTTANELHLPVGKLVKVRLTSNDVIHSFWVPTLMGKMDLIPGIENELRFSADHAGTYRGQCAEFCGFQHAHMALLVVAEAPDQYERWRIDQIKAAEPPDGAERRRGLDIFLSSPCVMCHRVRGTAAGARVGPDLTHLASRQYIAAGTLPLTRGALAAWIVDPHGVKPGVNMPQMKLEADEIHPLLSYLEGLK